MSTPLNFSVVSELISACSALNTETTYKGESQNEDGDWVFISEAEPMAAHSIEHIYAAIQLLRDLSHELNDIANNTNESTTHDAVIKLMLKL